MLGAGDSLLTVGNLLLGDGVDFLFDAAVPTQIKSSVELPLGISRDDQRVVARIDDNVITRFLKLMFESSEGPVLREQFALFLFIPLRAKIVRRFELVARERLILVCWSFQSQFRACR